MSRRIYFILNYLLKRKKIVYLQKFQNNKLLELNIIIEKKEVI